MFTVIPTYSSTKDLLNFPQTFEPLQKVKEWGAAESSSSEGEKEEEEEGKIVIAPPHITTFDQALQRLKSGDSESFITFVKTHKNNNTQANLPKKKPKNNIQANINRIQRCIDRAKLENDKPRTEYHHNRLQKYVQTGIYEKASYIKKKQKVAVVSNTVKQQHKKKKEPKEKKEQKEQKEKQPPKVSKRNRCKYWSDRFPNGLTMIQRCDLCQTPSSINVCFTPMYQFFDRKYFICKHCVVPNAFKLVDTNKMASDRIKCWVYRNGIAMFSTCHCCSKTLNFTSSDWHMAHNLAKKLGGTTHPSNMFTTCSDCNYEMNTRSMDDFMNSSLSSKDSGNNSSKMITMSTLVQVMRNM